MASHKSICLTFIVGLCLPYTIISIQLYIKFNLTFLEANSTVQITCRTKSMLKGWCSKHSPFKMRYLLAPLHQGKLIQLNLKAIYRFIEQSKENQKYLAATNFELVYFTIQKSIRALVF
jgi:hypothetical protein